MKVRLAAAEQRLAQAETDLDNGRIALEDQRVEVTHTITSIYEQGDPQLLAVSSLLQATRPSGRARAATSAATRTVRAGCRDMRGSGAGRGGGPGGPGPVGYTRPALRASREATSIAAPGSAKDETPTSTSPTRATATSALPPSSVPTSSTASSPTPGISSIV